jgi:hypothetical protein
MNRFYLLSFLALSLIVSCKKDDDNGPSGNGGGGGGGTDTTGTNGNGLVTSWSPMKPYPDDVITLIGGPFNTNVAQNSVVSGDDFDIISVSSTQLVVQPPAGWSPNTGGFSTIYIQSGTVADTLYPFYWKRPFNLMSFENNLDDWWVGAPARPGDSVMFNFTGATYSGMSVSINGQPIPGPFTVDSAFYCTVAFRIPVSMGSGDDENETTTTLMSATNADGRTDTLTIGWAPTPDMEVFGVEIMGGGTTFDQSDMIGLGQVLNIRVHGKYMHSTAPWTLSGPSPASGTLGVGGYPDEAFVVVNPVSMSPGAYTFGVQGIGNSVSFSIVP